MLQNYSLHIIYQGKGVIWIRVACNCWCVIAIFLAPAVSITGDKRYRDMTNRATDCGKNLLFKKSPRHPKVFLLGS